MIRKRAGGMFALLGVLLFLGALGYAGLFALGGWVWSDQGVHAQMCRLAVPAIGLLVIGLGKLCYSYRRKGMSVLLGIMIACYLVLVAYCGVEWWRQTQRWNTYEAIVMAVRTGTLKADKQGDILLPASWSWATCNGHVYVMQGKGLTLLFPTAVDRLEEAWGINWQIAGIVYSSDGLPKNQAFAFIKPDCDSVSDGDGEVLRPHWYFAEPFYS